jgi:hypothetical protein
VNLLDGAAVAGVDAGEVEGGRVEVRRVFEAGPLKRLLVLLVERVGDPRRRANLAKRDLTQLTALAKSRLRLMQYRPISPHITVSGPLPMKAMLAPCVLTGPVLLNEHVVLPLASGAEPVAVIR